MTVPGPTRHSSSVFSLDSIREHSRLGLALKCMVVRVAYLLNTVARWSLTAIALAALLAVIAATLLTPPPAFTPAAGFAGWPRLILYALAGVALAVTAPRVCVTWRI